MDLNFVNYTGLPLFIKHGKTGYKIGCGSAKTINITPSAAKFTRFVAEYKSGTLPAEGMINILLDSKLTYQTIILRAIIGGQATAITCIDQDKKYKTIGTTQYKDAIYYNISVPIDDSNFGKFKQYIGVSLSDIGCENRDSLLCDKFFGIPVAIIVFIIFISVCILGIFVAGYAIIIKDVF